jgi:hypothetical protein
MSKIILIWSIGEMVSYISVTDKSSDRNRDRPPKNVPVVKW